MPSNLRFAIAIPSSGGKTTLSDTFPATFLDVDRFYNLRESPPLWNAMNHEIYRRTQVKERAPISVAIDLRERIGRYRGPASCLLVHSIAAAEESHLSILGVLVPSEELHSIAMDDRNDISKWFAMMNSECLVLQAKEKRIKLRRYDDWEELREIIEELVPPMNREIGMNPHSLDNACSDEEVTDEARDLDMHRLLALCTTATGCEFEGKLLADLG